MNSRETRSGTYDKDLNRIEYYGQIKWEREQEWRYTAHSVVKYKPEYYSEKGYYTKDEWGCMGDVVRVYDNHLLTLDEYLKVILLMKNVILVAS